MSKNEAPRVFVSYAHKNDAIVLPVIESIMNRGYSVWYDKGIHLASTWTDEVAQAIIGSEIVIAFISKEFVASKYARGEVEFALSLSKRVIPVYLDDMDILPPGLALGLSATQGVIGKTNALEIASQICAGLEFYAVRKQRAEQESRKRKRRVLSTLAIIAVLIALIGVGVGVRGYYLSVGEPLPDPYKVTLDKQIYLPYEKIFEKIPQLTPEMINDRAVVGVWDKNEQNGSLSKAYYAGLAADSTRLLRAPIKAGEYETRFYVSMTERSSKPEGVAKFSVAKGSLGAFGVAIDKDEYALDEPINVVISGVTDKMLDDEPIVGLYQAFTRHDEYAEYAPIRANDYSVSFTVSAEGEYEIRAYSNSKTFRAETLVASARFSAVKK